MSDPHARWCELADAEAVGDALDDEALAFLRDHGDDPAHADEQRFYDELAQLAQPAPVRADDRERAELTLARFRAAAARRRVRAVTVAMVAIAAAVVLSWAIVAALAPEREAARIERGGFELAGDALAVGDTVPDGQWLRATTATCVELTRARACVDEGSELRFVAGRIELRSGAVRVEQGRLVVLRGDEASASAAELAAGERVAIATAAAAATPDPAAPTELAPLLAEAPRASASSAATPPVQLQAPPPTPTDRRPTRVAPVASAGEMLAAARALANAKATSRALAAYEALRRAHPESAEAHAANVSIGELQLRRRRFAAALTAFGRYLERGGALAEEARWGRVRALDGLGRAAARDTAIEALLAAHPGTIYADEAASMRGR